MKFLCCGGYQEKLVRLFERTGHESLAYQIIADVLWFAGEILGGVFGVIMSVVVDDSFGCLIYIFALFGAVVGGVAAYFLATFLKPADPTSPSSSSVQDF